MVAKGQIQAHADLPSKEEEEAWYQLDKRFGGRQWCSGCCGRYL